MLIYTADLSSRKTFHISSEKHELARDVTQQFVKLLYG